MKKNEVGSGGGRGQSVKLLKEHYLRDLSKLLVVKVQSHRLTSTTTMNMITYAKCAANLDVTECKCSTSAEIFLYSKFAGNKHGTGY